MMGISTGNFSFFLVVLQPVLDKIDIKKVLKPVSEKFGMESLYQKYLVPENSIGIGDILPYLNIAN